MKNEKVKLVLKLESVVIKKSSRYLYFVKGEAFVDVIFMDIEYTEYLWI